jgi:hypothetical protein
MVKEFSEKEPLLPAVKDAKVSKTNYLKWALLLVVLSLSTAFLNSFYVE